MAKATKKKKTGAQKKSSGARKSAGGKKIAAAKKSGAKKPPAKKPVKKPAKTALKAKAAKKGPKSSKSTSTVKNAKTATSNVKRPPVVARPETAKPITHQNPNERAEQAMAAAEHGETNGTGDEASIDEAWVDSDADLAAGQADEADVKDQSAIV